MIWTRSRFDMGPNLSPERSVRLPMTSQLQQYAADHRRLLDLVARRAGFASPIAVDLDEFYEPLMRHARKGDFLPIDGVLVRDWDPANRKAYPLLLLAIPCSHAPHIPSAPF